jgi:hypothetical protein
LRGLCDEYPAVPDFAYELTEALGDFHVEGLTPDDDQIATNQLREAIAISDKLIAAHPQTTAYLASNVHLHNRLAAIEGRRGRREEEEQANRKAFELQLRLAAQFPDSSQQAEWTGRIALKFADSLLRLGRRDEAAKTLEAGVDGVKKFLATAASPPNSTAEMARELERRLAELQAAGKTD